MEENAQLKGPSDLTNQPAGVEEGQPAGTTTRAKTPATKLNSTTFTSLDEEVERYLAKERLASSVPPDSDVSYCGPNVTKGFLEALALIAARIEALPDDQLGVMDSPWFMLRNGQEMDYFPRYEFWRGSFESCPSNTCIRNDKCYQLFDECVPRHMLSDTMYAFVAGLLGMHVRDAVAGGVYAEFNKPTRKKEVQEGFWAGFDEITGFEGKGTTAAVRLVLDDMGFWDSNMKEVPASVGAYYYGHSLATAILEGKINGEDQTPITDIRPEDVIDEETGESTFEKYFKVGLDANYQWLLKCEDCPDQTPLYTYGWVQGIFVRSKDFSRHFWLLPQGLYDDPKYQYVNDEFMFLDPFEDEPKVLSTRTLEDGTEVVEVEDKLNKLAPTIYDEGKKPYLRPWEWVYNNEEIEYDFSDENKIMGAETETPQ